jgi:iron complex transport system permease protein
VKPAAGFGAARRYFALLMLVLLPVSLVLAMAVGSVRIEPGEVARIVGAAVLRAFRLGGQGGAPGERGQILETIVLQVRMPRVLLAAIVGAALAVAGAAFQAVFRNPLADPYILGASTGGALGAAAAVVSGLSMASPGYAAAPALAFLGAVAAVGVAYRLARRGGGVSTLSLLLAGVVVGTWAGSALSLLIYFSGRFLAQIVFWLMGGFTGTTWWSLGVSAPYMTLGALIVFLRARDLNALALGDETALGLGVDAERSRRAVVAGATLLVAAAVAVSGPIGFVGLIIPHLVRLAVGADHWHLLPGAAAAGALLMVLADAVARTAIAPSELPVGIVTALAGGPFFLWLLGRRGRDRLFGGNR